MSYNLLGYSKGGGCGCKIDPIRLKAILNGHRKNDSEQIFIDFLDKDDASVFEINADTCIIQSLDFFLPIVENASDFGKIAAANALSDIYAMGGSPITALSILGWPLEKLPAEVASEVIQGAEEICVKAGIHISGGHSIETSEPIFGLSVSGMVEKINLKRKDSCIDGDYLYLSKPLGIGLMANAIKYGKLSTSGYLDLMHQTCTLNTIGTNLAKFNHVHAMTDITGFGLLGHLTEMLNSSMGAVLYRDAIPVIEEAKNLASQMLYPNITTSNYNYIKDHCDGLEGLEFLWLCDPQTSGGLLISSSKELNNESLTLIGKVNTSKRIQLL